MKIKDVMNNIGAKVYLNGKNDLGMDSLFKPYLQSKIPLIFTIIKVTRCGLVYIQCNNDKKFLVVKAKNLDLIN